MMVASVDVWAVGRKDTLKWFERVVRRIYELISRKAHLAEA